MTLGKTPDQVLLQTALPSPVIWNSKYGILALDQEKAAKDERI